MLFYLLVAGDPDGVERIFRRSADALGRTTPFRAKSVVHKMAQNRSWALASCGSPDPLVDERIAISNRGALVINGPVLSAAKHGISAADLLEQIADSNPEQLFQSLRGCYNCASFTLRHGLVAFSDFSGMYPVYVNHTADCTVVSNSPMAAAAARSVPTVDYRCLSWLIGHANIFGSAMPQGSVEVIPPGSYIAGRPSSHQGLARPFEDNVWPRGDSPCDREDLSSAEWDDLASHLIENIQSAVGPFPSIRLSLTGGKDSRLVLALALAAGLQDRIKTFTTGPADSPEVACAREIADLVGVEHEAIVSRAARRREHSATWDRLRKHVFRYAGIVCPWDGTTDDVDGMSAELTGFGGELYRGPGGHAKQFKDLRFLDADDLAPFWVDYHQPMDPLGLLTQDARHFQVEWLEQWITQQSQLWRRDVLPEKFYVENRLCHWNGPLAQNVLGRVKLTPLLSSRVARSVFQLSAVARTQERLHFEIMARASPTLVAAPFLQATWHEQVRNASAIEVAGEPWQGPRPVTPRSIQAWQWEFVEQQKQEIVALLREADAAVSLSSLFDVGRLCQRVTLGEWTRVVEVKTVLSAVAIAMVALNMGERPRDRP